MKDKPNYYAIIPAIVRYDNDLKPNEKLLYGEITALTNKTGACFATNSYFAQLYGVDKATVSKWIKNLKEKKYIKVVIQYKLKTREILNRAIIVNGTPITGKINTYFIGKKNNIPEWLGKEIEPDEATIEEQEEFDKFLAKNL